MNTERETILRQLAEYDYPDWCEWVTIDDSHDTVTHKGEVWAWGECPKEKIPGVWWNGGKERGIAKLKNPKSYLFTISEINQAKEEVRADLKNIDNAMHEALKDDTELLSTGRLNNDWYNRETIQDNINSMFPDNGKPYQCRQMLVEGVLSNPCSCKQEFGTVEELKAHLIEKRVVADGHVPTTILNLFRK